jgi:hypothetical protein
VHVSLLPTDTNNDPNYWGNKWYRPGALPPLDREFNVQQSKRDWEDKLEEMQVCVHVVYTYFHVVFIQCLDYMWPAVHLM